MTLRRALLALSLVAVAASAAASPSQSVAPAPAAPASQASPATTSAPTATRAARPDETPVDPIAIAFEVSVDHDATDAAGPKLLKYLIDFVPAEGAAGKSHTMDLGKPKPVEGAISVPLTKVLVPGTYVAHVRAVGRNLQMNTVTVGPFVITEKLGKTKAEIDKELRAPDKPQPREKPLKKKPSGTTQTESQPAAPPPPPAPPDTASPKDTKDRKDANDGKTKDPKDPKDSTKPAPKKDGFWKKVYGKVVG